MSADMHIITFDPTLFDPERVKSYVNFNPLEELNQETSEQKQSFQELNAEHNAFADRLYHAEDSLDHMDNIWIGQVSWLKASFGLGQDKYIPAVVQHTFDVFASRGGATIVDEEFIRDILAGFDLPSSSVYESTPPADEEDNWYAGIAKKDDTEKWLRDNIGKWVFADSW
jgi:hypothetical protein